MTPDQLRENFPGHAALVDQLDGEGFNGGAILAEIVRRLTEQSEVQCVA
jgi:hypothetical protein